MRPTHLAALAALALAAPVYFADALETAPVGTSVGDIPTYSFRSAGLDGGGVKSLADLRGKPVLVDFWGVKCPPCVGFAVPKGVEMQRKYGDDLQVIFVESQGHTAEQVERLAYQRGWMGSNAIWTLERPFDVGLNGIPHFALLDCDGKIILQGYSQELHSQLEELVAQQVALVQKGPKDLPKELKGAWKASTKGEYAAAIQEARAAEAKGITGVPAFVQRVESLVHARLRRIEWLIEDGRADLAAADAQTFAKATQGLADIGDRAAALAARLASADMKAELEAAKQLGKLKDALAADKLDSKGIDKKLEKLAEKHPGTHAARRAQQLLTLVTAG